MPFKLKQVELLERKELEPLIVAHPEAIEKGLRVITHQQGTDSGPLDVLGVDAGGTLVVMELKNEAEETHLDQGLRYYDWCRQNLAWIAQAYKNYNINCESSPVLMLIAPAFTDTVLRIAKYVDVELRLFEYHAVANEKGEKDVIFTEKDFGQPVEPSPIPTLEKKLEYFKEEKIRALFKKALNELQARGVEVKPINGLWISFWYKNKRFMYMSPKRNFFVVDILSTNGEWEDRRRILKAKDWQKAFKDGVLKYIEYLDANE